MENIIWKQFTFNDKIYFINNYGDVIDYNNKKISQHYDKDGYKIIKLGKSRKIFKIHRLVAQLFIPIIKEMFQNNFSIAQIARKFNVGWSTINHIVKNETWKHIN